MCDIFSTLEQLIMTRIRSKRQRPVSFEALEGRLALSTGMGMAVAWGHTRALASAAYIPASFKGHVQILDGTNLVVTNLRGKIAGSPMTGYGTGMVAGKQFESGNVYLSNSAGTVQLGLGSSFVVTVKRSSRTEVPVVILDATGQYAPYIGITGTMTKWNIPARPRGTANFSGSFSA
jgi:hypothetical protein